MTGFLDLLASRGPVLGTWVKLPAVESVELMALAGFDFVVIDLEHSALSLETVSTMIAVGLGRSLTVLVRVPDHSPSWISRCLDAGAAGVVLPRVDSVEQAVSVARAARFPPDGDRGVGPTTRAGDWGLAPLDDYLRSGARAALLAQIESPDGVAAVDAVAAVHGLDALFVGPADLSVAMGRQANDPEVLRSISHVLAVGTEAGRPVGTAVGLDVERAQDLLAEGFSFVLVSNDATMLGQRARDLVRDVRAGARSGRPS